jgi:uncharacterized protein YlxW (UPF0749 family)
MGSASGRAREESGMKEYERSPRAADQDLIEAVRDLRRAVDDVRAEVRELAGRLASFLEREPGRPASGR